MAIGIFVLTAEYNLVFGDCRSSRFIGVFIEVRRPCQSRSICSRIYRVGISARKPKMKNSLLEENIYTKRRKFCQLPLTCKNIFISTHKFAFKTFRRSNVSFRCSSLEHFKKSCNSLPFDEEVCLTCSSECVS